MYLEERVEQLEHLAADQGRQIETIAKGLADLTTDVRAIRHDMTDGFIKINDEFVRVNQRFDEMQQTQQLILKLLTDRL